MSPRLIAWLVTLPLAVAGTQLAHALAYRLTTPIPSERAAELSATGHGYAAYLPLALALGAVLVASALVSEVRRLATTSAHRPAQASAWRFAVVAPAVFVAQEHLERFLHDGTFPWDAALAATFIAGLLLQLPFALAAYALARALLRAAHSLGVLLARQGRRLRPAALPWPVRQCVMPRLPALAYGYGSRGPPRAPR